MTPAQQRPLFAESPSSTPEFLRSLEREARPPPPPSWVWLTGDFALSGGPDAALRVCCEPTSWPDPPAWRLTAWERVVLGPRREPVGCLYCTYRDDCQFGLISRRLPAPHLAAGVRRVQQLQRAVAECADPNDRQRRAELLAQTQRAMLLLWRDDHLACVDLAVAAIFAAEPVAQQLGHVDRGAVLLDVEDYCPPVTDPAQWELMKLCLRYGGRA